MKNEEPIIANEKPTGILFRDSLLRDYFAAKVIANAAICDSQGPSFFEDNALIAYKQADAMMKARLA